MRTQELKLHLNTLYYHDYYTAWNPFMRTRREALESGIWNLELMATDHRPRVNISGLRRFRRLNAAISVGLAAAGGGRRAGRLNLETVLSVRLHAKLQHF